MLRNGGILIGAIWLSLLFGTAHAADICEAVALVDIPNSPASIETGDDPIAIKKGEIDEAVTQYSVDRKTGVGSFCSHGGGCYPRYLTVGGKKVEALRLRNCTIGAADPDPYDDTEIIYSIDVDRSRNDAATLRYDDVDNALLEVGMSSAGASNAADRFIKEPKSQCGRVVSRALGGDQGAKAELQGDPQYCLSYSKEPEPVDAVSATVSATPGPTVGVDREADHSVRNTIFLIVVAVASLYFIPTIVAVIRKKRNVTAIAILNVFLGWTFLGWVAALVWSCLKDDPLATRIEGSTGDVG